MQIQSIRKEEIHYVEFSEMDYIRFGERHWEEHMPLSSKRIMDPKLLRVLEGLFQRWMR